MHASVRSLYHTGGKSVAARHVSITAAGPMAWAPWPAPAFNFVAPAGGLTAHTMTTLSALASAALAPAAFAPAARPFGSSHAFVTAVPVSAGAANAGNATKVDATSPTTAATTRIRLRM